MKQESINNCNITRNETYDKQDIIIGMKENNTYFENMKQIIDEYNEKLLIHESKKKNIVDTYGWGSNELQIWYDEKEKIELPFYSGECKAYKAFKQSILRNEDELVVNDFIYISEVNSFIYTLRKAGINTFVYTNSATNLMENIHEFVKYGCTILEPCTITRQEVYAEDVELIEIMGIRFLLD